MTPMPILDAVVEVLRRARRVMPAGEIADEIQRRGLAASSSKRFETIVSGRVYQDIKARRERRQPQRFFKDGRHGIGLVSLGGKLRAPATRTEDGPMRIPDAIEKVLRDAGRSMRAAEIAEEIRRRGLATSSSKDFASIVSGRAYQDSRDRRRRGESPRFIKDGHGRIGLSSSSGSRTVPGARAVGESMYIHDAVEAVLVDTGRPMHTKEIADEIGRRGLARTSSRDFASIVSGRVYQDIRDRRKKGMPQRFVRNAHGYVSLATGSSAPPALGVGDAPWRQFEERGAELLRRLGLANVKVTPPTGDRGVDAWGTHTTESRKVVRVGLQAKYWRSAVGVREVRELRGVLRHSDIGLLITSGRPGNGAFNEAARPIGARIVVVSGSLIEELEEGDSETLAKWVRDNLG